MLIQDLNHIETVQDNLVGGSVSASSYADGLIIGYGSVSAYTSSGSSRNYGYYYGYSRSAYSSGGASAYGSGYLSVSAGSSAYA